jgi:hypothetical protein
MIGRGRPPTPEAELLQQAKMAQRVVDEELAAMPMSKLKQVLDRAARRLKVSTRTVQRRLAILRNLGSFGIGTLCSGPSVIQSSGSTG